MYTQLFELQAEFLKALAHPRRLEIIGLLREEQLCVSQIYEMLDLPQANISQHLMILREAKIVTTKRDGKQILYQLADTKILGAVDLIRESLVRQHHDPELSKQLRLSMKELTPLRHDPVCQMRLSPKTANFKSDYNGSEYYFCASGCYKKFSQDPTKYAKS